MSQPKVSWSGTTSNYVHCKLMFCEHDKKEEDIWSQVIPETDSPPREALYILSPGPGFDSMMASFTGTISHK